uniref:microcephalin isoform X2 n=1 Tax=Myxine glutinosa TaxID=7769 RepID=UPI00358F9EE6
MTCLGCTNEGKRIHALTQSLEVVCTVRDEAEDQEKENPFKDVVAFVEVWCSRKKENYSRSFDAHLIQLGAQVSKTFNKNVTHVVFKDGYRSTWKKAENKQVKLVSVLWVDSCVKAGKYLDEALFPASFEDDVTLPSRRRRPVPEPLNMDEWLITNEGRFQRELERRLKNLELEKAVGQASRILGYDDDGYPIYRPRLLSSPTPKIANSMANCLQRIKERRAFMSPSAPKKTAVIESSSTGSQENGSSSGTIRLFSDADEDGASTRHLQVDGDDAVQCCSVMLKPSTLTGNGTNKMRETNRTEEAPEDKVSGTSVDDPECDCSLGPVPNTLPRANMRSCNCRGSLKSLSQSDSDITTISSSLCLSDVLPIPKEFRNMKKGVFLPIGCDDASDTGSNSLAPHKSNCSSTARVAQKRLNDLLPVLNITANECNGFTRSDQTEDVNVVQQRSLEIAADVFDSSRRIESPANVSLHLPKKRMANRQSRGTVASSPSSSFKKTNRRVKEGSSGVEPKISKEGLLQQKTPSKNDALTPSTFDDYFAQENLHELAGPEQKRQQAIQRKAAELASPILARMNRCEMPSIECDVTVSQRTANRRRTGKVNLSKSEKPRRFRKYSVQQKAYLAEVKCVLVEELSRENDATETAVTVSQRTANRRRTGKVNLSKSEKPRRFRKYSVQQKAYLAEVKCVLVEELSRENDATETAEVAAEPLLELECDAKQRTFKRTKRTRSMANLTDHEECVEVDSPAVHLAHYVPSSRKTRNSQEPITLVGEKSTSQAINMVQNTSITDFIVHTKHPKRGASSKNKDLCKRPQVKMVLVMTSMHSEQQVLVQNIVKHLGQCKICDNVSNRTTHVVAGDHRRTLNVLRGISQGSWILSIDWVLESEEAGYWVDEEPYEMTDSFPGARINRRRLYHSSTAPDITPLFSNEPAFYVCPSSSPPEECLKDLIRAYGGRLCRSPHRAGIYVGRTARNALRSDCRVLSERWVLDCITQYKVLPMDDYLHHRHHTSHGRP